ncbi:MAG: DinB family protein [Chloroflexota bacterium]
MSVKIENQEYSLYTLFQHHIWSNDRVFDACLNLDHEQLQYASAGTYGSIKATLAHLVSAQEAFLWILIKQDAKDDRRANAEMSLDELKTRVQQCDALLLQVATSTESETMVEYRTSDEQMGTLPAMYVLLQAIHHGHEHRTHVTSMLGQLRIDPPVLSFWAYYEEQTAS